MMVMYLYTKEHWPSIRGSCFNELLRKLNIKFVEAVAAKAKPTTPLVEGETKMSGRIFNRLQLNLIYQDVAINGYVKRKLTCHVTKIQYKKITK